MAKRSVSQPENSTGNSSTEPTPETTQEPTPGTAPRKENDLNETPETNSKNSDEHGTNNTDADNADPTPAKRAPKKGQPKGNNVAIKLATKLGGNEAGDTINVTAGVAAMLTEQGYADPA